MTSNPPQTHNGKFIMQRYIQGLTKLKTLTKRKRKLNFEREALTQNDLIDIQSFLLFPVPIIYYSNINLHNASILKKAQLHLVDMNYWHLLKYNTRIRSRNVKNNKLFIQGLLRIIYDDDSHPGETKYMTFLDNLVPKTIEIFHLFKNYILGGLSYIDIIYQLEPFMIYNNDITFQQQKKIIEFMTERQNQWFTLWQSNNYQMQRYTQYDYNIPLVENFFYR